MTSSRRDHVPEAAGATPDGRQPPFPRDKDLKSQEHVLSSSSWATEESRTDPDQAQLCRQQSLSPHLPKQFIGKSSPALGNGASLHFPALLWPAKGLCQSPLVTAATTTNENIKWEASDHCASVHMWSVCPGGRGRGAFWPEKPAAFPCQPGAWKWRRANRCVRLH